MICAYVEVDVKVSPSSDLICDGHLRATVSAELYVHQHGESAHLVISMQILEEAFALRRWQIHSMREDRRQQEVEYHKPLQMCFDYP